jgi:peptidoglycan/LPS O-acetylase OafA/YrhL
VTSASETPVALKGEVRSLTGLRIVAALWVVCFHFSFTPGDAYTRYWEPLRPLVHTGALGVDLFYVLSGFVITLTYLDKLGSRLSVRGTVGFLWARICRIWPVYATVISLFGLWMLYRASRITDDFVVWQTVQPTVSWWHWLQQMLMIQLWDKESFAGSSWVGAAWSISAEWLAYLCFPVVVLVLFRLRKAPAPVLAVLAVACMLPFAYACYRTGDPYFDHSWLLRIAGGFLAGAFTCLAVRRVRVTRRVDQIAAVVAVIAVIEILAGVWWGFWRGQGGAEYGGVVVVFFPVLIGALALSQRGLSKALSAGPMVHGGRISYSLYLVHVPVFEIFWSYMLWEPRIGPGSALGSFLVPQVLLFVVLLAHLAYTYIEEPARKALRRRGPGRWVSRRPVPARVLADGTRDGVAQEGTGVVGASVSPEADPERPRAVQQAPAGDAAVADELVTHRTRDGDRRRSA